MTDIELKAQLAEVTKQLQDAQATIAAAKDKNWEKQVEALKAEATVVADKLAKANEAVAAAEKTKTDLEAQVKDLSTKATEADKAKAAAEVKLAQIETEKTLAARLVAVKAAYGTEDEEDAKAFLNNGLATLTDEQFAKAIEAATQYMAKKAAAYKLGESKVSNEPAPMSGKPKKVGDSILPATSPAPTTNVNLIKTATAGALDNAVPTDTTALAAGGEQVNEFEQTQADVLAYFCPEENAK